MSRQLAGGGGFQLVSAQRAVQIRDAELVRYRVYSEEERLVGAHGCPEVSEVDSHEFSERTKHLIVYSGAEPIGTVRLALARARGASDAAQFGFELESSFILGGFALQGVVPAEVTRFCILRRFRGTRVASLLYAGLLAESARLGVTHLVAEANMETDCAGDAALAYRLVRERQWTDSRFSAVPRRSASPPANPTRFVYTEEQRCRSRPGALAEVELPRTLTLFAQRMRGRYIGPPVYEPHFNVFALPLVAQLSD
ncbi:MAG: GNAT family N-acetyltransferase [Polyangiaceae bacterium]